MVSGGFSLLVGGIAMCVCGKETAHHTQYLVNGNGTVSAVAGEAYTERRGCKISGGFGIGGSILLMGGGAVMIAGALL